jgi:hypothetical protein
MDNLKQIFLNALLYKLKDCKRGDKSALAKKAGLRTPTILSDILRGDYSPEESRRAIANALGYGYEEFLDIGRRVRDGKDPEPEEDDFSIIGLSQEELRERGFISVPFSEDLRLDAGRGGTIPVTSDADVSPVIVHGPSLGRRTARNLQAFRVGGDSMEPVIAAGGIVMADLSENNPMNLKQDKIYVLCIDMQDGICAVKYLRWGVKGESVIISSHDSQQYGPISRSLEEIQLIGRVIWAWREFK